MPEILNERKVFSLLEVTKSIQKTLAERYKSSFWVKAEMNKLNYSPQSGHCYPELVEKKNGSVIAQIKSNLWNSDYKRVNDRFLAVLNEPLKDGINILFLAQINFDPIYGLSLRIVEIDTSYSLGELEREKRETIEKLRAEGIFLSNKKLILPLLPRRIAIISVETSKGYADFLKIIEQNPWGYKFFCMLFPALLQGEKAIDSILSQLIRIRRVRTHFDVVAIIRGGGGDVGLSVYNNHKLSRELALFPLPILTGIGHSTNETVSELVAFKNSITPTALGEYLLQRFHNYSVPLKEAKKVIVDYCNQIIKDEKSLLRSSIKSFISATSKELLKCKYQLQNSSKSLGHQSIYILSGDNQKIDAHKQQLRNGTSMVSSNAKNRLILLTVGMQKDTLSSLHQNNLLLINNMARLSKLVKKMFRVCPEHIENSTRRLKVSQGQFTSKKNAEIIDKEKVMEILNPQNILRRGYSITMLNGSVIKDAGKIKKGDSIITVTRTCNIESTVDSINNN